MDNESHIAIPLETLLDILRANGFKDIGTTAILDIQKILANLNEEEIKDFRKLKSYLSPIICRNKEDQENFSKVFDVFVAEIERQTQKEEKKEDSFKRPKLVRNILIAAGIVVLAGIITWLRISPPQPTHKTSLRLSQTNYSSQTDETVIGDSIVYEVTLHDTVSGKKYTTDWKLHNQPYPNLRELKTRYDHKGSYTAFAYLKNEDRTVIDSGSISTDVLAHRTPGVTIQSIDSNDGKKYNAVLTDNSYRTEKYKYNWYINNTFVSGNKSFFTTYRSQRPYEIKLLIYTKGLYHDPEIDSLEASVRVVPDYSLIASASSVVQSSSVFLGGNLAWMILALLLIPAAIAILVFRFLNKPKSPSDKQIPPTAGSASLLKHKKPDKPADGPYFIDFKKQDYKISPEEQIRRLADGLRKRQLSDIYKLHLKKTINKTIKASGFPSFVFVPQTKPVDFLAFVDKEHPDGHTARLFEYLLERLRSEEVHIAIYDFYKEPLYLNSQKFNHVLIPLDKIVQLFPGTVLFVFTSAEYFFEPMKPKLKSWVEEKFKSWETRIIITPIPRADWSYKEFILQQSGFAIIPADLYQNNLLKILLDFVGLQIETTKKEKIEIPKTYSARYFNFQDYVSLDKYLNDPQLLEWVSATAVYPTVDWKVTLAIGKALEEQDKSGKKALVTYENLLKISRISWMNDGIIDDTLRLEMLESISNDTEAIARKALVVLLDEIKEQFTGDAFAKEEFELHSNSNKVLVNAYDQSAPVNEETVAAVKDYFEKGYLDWPQTTYYQKGQDTLMKGDSNTGSVPPETYFNNLDQANDEEKRLKEAERRKKERRRKLVRNLITGVSLLMTSFVGGIILNQSDLLQLRKIVPGNLQVVFNQTAPIKELGDFIPSIRIDTSVFSGRKENDSTFVFSNLPSTISGSQVSLFIDPPQGDQLSTNISADSSYSIALGEPAIEDYKITTRIYLSRQCSRRYAPYRQMIENADNTLNLVDVSTNDALANKNNCLNSISYGRNVPIGKVNAVVQSFSKEGITLQIYSNLQSLWPVSDTGIAIYYQPGPTRPVVYIQYNNRKNISDVRRLQTCMNQGIFNVPGVEYQSNFTRNEIRYYANSTKDSIALLQNCLRSVYPGRVFYPVMVPMRHSDARAEVWIYDSILPPPTVFIRISDSSLRTSAEGFKKALESSNYVVPSIIVDNYPSNSQIYYFKQVDSDNATDVLQIYRKYYPALPLKTQLTSNYSRINSGIVVWIKKRESPGVDSPEVSKSRLASIASAEIGYKESPLGSNRTKYGEWFGLNGQSWSAIFVSWVYYRAGQPLPPLGGKSGFASYSRALEYFRKTKYITNDPVPGDIVIFDVSGKSDQFENYSGGIFIDWTDQKRGTYSIIQGNAAPTGSAQGEGVYKMTRNINSFKTYFIHIENRSLQSQSQ